MTVPLDFGLIKAIVGHGARTGPGQTVDPSTSPELQRAGVAKVTAYIEKLALLDLVGDPVPLLGAGGGMWIGYQLASRGRACADSEAALRDAVRSLAGEEKTEVSEAVASLRRECATAPLNDAYRDDFLRTLEEIGLCFDAGCFIASIALCGRVLEVVLKEILLRHDVPFDANAMVGSLIRAVREQVPSEYLDPALVNVVNIINSSRIAAVHAKERIPVPSRDQAIMVIFAMRDVVRRNLSHSSRR